MQARRALSSMAIVAVLIGAIAACSASPAANLASSPSPLVSASPAVPPSATPSPASSMPSPVASLPTPLPSRTPTPTPTAKVTARPKPTAVPSTPHPSQPASPRSKVIGWPTVSRDGVQLAATVKDSEAWNGRLQVDVTATGLGANGSVSLDSHGSFRLAWACGDAAQPSAQPTTYTTQGDTYVPSLAVAGPDGTVRVHLEFAPPADSLSCSTTAESWTVYIADEERLLYLTMPEPLVRAPS
jgi:hypothetical protein